MKAKAPIRVVSVEKVLPPDWLLPISRDHHRLALGLDVGTTTNQKSNPSVLALAQQVNQDVLFPLIVRFKTRDPAVTSAIVAAVLTGLRGIGLRPRRLCVDATSEKFFAIDLRRQLRTKIRTELIVSSEKITVEGEDMLWKVYLGNLLVQALEDGFAALPNVPWIKTDIRSVSRDRGSFSAEVLEDGGHGDVFDGCKLALHGIDAKGGPAKAEGAGTQSATRANLGKIGPRHPMATRRAI